MVFSAVALEHLVRGQAWLLQRLTALMINLKRRGLSQALCSARSNNDTNSSHNLELPREYDITIWL